jgi:serine/threonine protein phosphatase PrpC
MELLDITANTDKGKQRQDNQDTLICMKIWNGDQALIGVIDGVGGYEGGDRAAAIAKESIEQYMSVPKGDALSMLKEAVVSANNRIVEEREKNQQLAQMCCVLTVAVVDARAQLLYYTHVGDTRLYRQRNNQLEKITRDHSLVGVREDAGELTEEEAMQHPRRNVILRQVGSEYHRIDDPEFLEFGQTDFLPADLLLICSDGLTDMINRAQMMSILEKQIPLRGKVTALIALANEMGGNDNITVVLAKNKSRAKPLQPRRKTPSATADIPVDLPATPTDAPKKSKRNKLIGGIIVAAVILTLVWWFTNKEVPETTINPPGTQVNAATIIDKDGDANNTASIPAANFNTDSLIARTIDSNSRQLLLEKLGDKDTIELNDPIRLAAIRRVTGRNKERSIVMPGPGSKSLTAFEVTGDSILRKKDTIVFKNLLISGFETGIRVQGKTLIRLENVIFDKVKHPVSYENAGDTGKTKHLSFQ